MRTSTEQAPNPFTASRAGESIPPPPPAPPPAPSPREAPSPAQWLAWRESAAPQDPLWKSILPPAGVFVLLALITAVALILDPGDRTDVYWIMSFGGLFAVVA